MAGLFDDEVVARHLPSLTFEQRIDRIDLYYGIDFGALKKKCPLDNGKHGDKLSLQYAASTATMGQLDIFSTEVRNAIFLELDIQSLTNLRATNKYSRKMVDVHPQYHAIITHAKDVVRAILSVCLAQHITCAVLYSSLCTSQCVKCDTFGPYIYLLTGCRVCYFCLTQEDDFLPFKPMHARQVYGLDAATLSSLPTMKSVAGTYPGRWNEKKSPRTPLVDSQTARKAGIALHSSAHMMDQYVEAKRASAQADYEDRLSTYQRTLEGKKPHRPTGSTYADRKILNIHRYLGVVNLPWLDPRSGIIEWGVSCVQCRFWMNDDTNILKEYVMYTKEEYLDHFEECEKSQERLTDIIEGEQMRKEWREAKEEKARVAAEKVRADAKVRAEENEEIVKDGGSNIFFRMSENGRWIEE
ncbi:hypothetical protein MMC27_007811 [Xylographa pallens]|nr:hypothetical protein [Xylographa pallens]